jgi:hypothetical protein
MKRATLRKRAERYAKGWAIPTYQCGKYGADFRVTMAWLWGYEAARRDARRAEQSGRKYTRNNGTLFI